MTEIPNAIAFVGSLARWDRIEVDFVCDRRDRRLIVVCSDNDRNKIMGGRNFWWVEIGTATQRHWSILSCGPPWFTKVTSAQAREMIASPEWQARRR